MEFTCSRDEISQAVQICQRAVAARASLPILTGLFLELTDEGLRLVGTDLDLGIETFVPVTAAQTGSAVVEARYFADIVRRLPEADVSISANDEKRTMEIRSGKAFFQIHTMEPRDFPALPQVDGQKSWAIEQWRLRDLVRQTSFAVAIDDNRPFLTGVLIDISEDDINFVATDAYRMALRHEVQPNPVRQAQVIVPNKALSELLRILDPSAEEPIQVNIGQSHVVFTLERTRVITRLIEGTFPNYRQIIPKSIKSEVLLNRQALQSAVERASLLARDGASVIKIEIGNEGNDGVEISASVAEVGQVYEQIPFLSFTGEPVEIALNARYLADVLRVLDSEEVRFQFTGNRSPSIVRPSAEYDYTYMIMPVMFK